MQRRLRNFTVGVLTSAMLASTASAGTLMVYSSTDADNLKYYMDEFQKDNPDIKVNVVRESTGTLAAKMMAEKDNPQADVLFEMAATVALNMEAAGMFHPYTPKGMDGIDQRYVDSEGEVNWVGTTVGRGVFAGILLKLKNLVCQNHRAGPISQILFIKGISRCQIQLRRELGFLMFPVGSKSWVRTKPGITWTHCTKMWAFIRTLAPNLVSKQVLVNFQ